jgi:hypothetical protein
VIPLSQAALTTHELASWRCFSLDKRSCSFLSRRLSMHIHITKILRSRCVRTLIATSWQYVSAPDLRCFPRSRPHLHDLFKMLIICDLAFPSIYSLSGPPGLAEELSLWYRAHTNITTSIREA